MELRVIVFWMGKVTPNNDYNRLFAIIKTLYRIPILHSIQYTRAHCLLDRRDKRTGNFFFKFRLEMLENLWHVQHKCLLFLTTIFVTDHHMTILMFIYR